MRKLVPAVIAVLAMFGAVPATASPSGDGRTPLLCSDDTDGFTTVWTCPDVRLKNGMVSAAGSFARSVNGPGPVEVRIVSIGLWKNADEIVLIQPHKMFSVPGAEERNVSTEPLALDCVAGDVYTSYIAWTLKWEGDEHRTGRTLRSNPMYCPG